LDDLLPIVKTKAQAFLKAGADQGIHVLITSTYRDNESQAALHAKGRTTPGKKVTDAKPGESWHNWRVAFDLSPSSAGIGVTPWVWTSVSFVANATSVGTPAFLHRRGSSAHSRGRYSR
jgi:hypothetical protein